MKKILALSLSVIISLPFMAQQTFYYKVKTSPSNTLYQGFNNPIQLVDTTLWEKAKTFVLKMNNGMVTRRNNTTYLLPARTGEATLKILQPKGKDTVLIGEQVFKVKPVYMPVLALAGKVLDSTVSKAELMKEQHMRVLIPECDYQVRFALTNCKFRFPNGRTYAAPQGVIGYPIKMELSRLKPGSKLCFEEIRILEFSGNERKLENACYVVTE
jgi:hypothetical protein